MPISQKKRITNDRYNAKCDAITIRPLKPAGERIRRSAKASGKSLQGYILDAVDEQIKKDEDGENIPQGLLSNLIKWLKEKNLSEDQILDCVEAIGKTSDS